MKSIRRYIGRRAWIVVAWMLFAPLLMGRTANAAPRKKKARRQPAVQRFDPQAVVGEMFGAAEAASAEELAKVTVSPEEETEFGRQAADAFLADLKRQKIRLVDRGRDVEYLKSLIERVHPLLENRARYETFTVYVADSDKTDARCFPGGTLVFFRGLLDFAENEAAMIGVVAHELSHLEHGHQLLPIKQMKYAQQTFSGSSRDLSPARFARAGQTLATSLMRPFRPEDEAEADLDATRWAYRLGYDPRELAHLFERVHERDGDGETPWGSFFRTHPFSLDRSRAVGAEYDRLQRESPSEELHIGKENLRRRKPWPEWIRAE